MASNFEVDIKDLFSRGVHYGHLARRWNPKMKNYIHKAQDGIHIIDLTQTADALREAHDYLRDLVAQGGNVLFVSTKKQAKDFVKKAAGELGMPYIAERWVGGILTNWETVKKNIQKLAEYKKNPAAVTAGLTKKEINILSKRMARLDSVYEGLLSMEKLPDAVFVIDVRREKLAVMEANRAAIAIVGVCDTNADPSDVSLVIPANDDALKSLEYLVDVVSRAVRSGLEMRGAVAENKDVVEKPKEDKKAKKPVAKKKKEAVEE